MAESHCRSQLAEAYTTRRRRAELTTELSRTVLESALYAEPAVRDERFIAAIGVADNFRNEGADDPWRLPVLVQRGVVELVWGELLREEAQTLNAPETALKPARDHLQTAVTQLRKARGEIEKQLQAASRSGAPSPKLDEPTVSEWTALKRNVDYQLARAYRNQGESYSPRSADRTAALDQALESLALLARSEMTDALTWQARLDEVVCRRLLGDLDGAERMLGLIDEQKPSPEFADRARAQRIRIRLNAGLPDEAQKFVKETDADPREPVDADVRLAVLEWMLATSRAAVKADRTAEAAERQKLAAAMARLIANQHSAYWARRAESLMAAAVAASPIGDAALLVKAAESMYQQGNADRAIEIYDQAVTKAQAAKQTDVAFGAAFTVAAIEQQRGRYAVAAERFLRLATTVPTHARAAEANLAGIFNTAQTLATLKSPEEVQTGFARYAELLERHLTQWPTDRTTTPQACLWLGRLRQRQRDWSAAVAAFSRVPPDDPHAGEAIAALAECFTTKFAAERAAGQVPSLDEAQSALTRFVPQLSSGDFDVHSPRDRSAARTLARLELEFADDRFDQATKLLMPFTATPDLPDAEALAAATLLVLAEVGVGRFDEAALRVGKLTSVSPAEAVVVADRLNSLPAKRSADVQAKVAPIVLRVLELRRLHDKQVGPSVAEARALAAAGRVAEAKRVWETLAQASPRDGDVQEGYAEFLATQLDSASMRATQAKWREVERLAAESSPRWYRARLGMARAYLQSGDKTRAAQILELTAALHPDLGGPALKAQFDELALRCK